MISSGFVTDAELALWRESILTATGHAAERILSSQLEPAAFDDALCILGEGAGVDRAYIFAFHPAAAGEEPRCSMLHERCAPEVESHLDKPISQNLSLADFGCSAWIAELRAGRSISGDVRNFPAPMRDVLEAQHTRSLALKPIHIHRALWGFIGFNDCRHEQVWTPGIVSCLRVAARVFGAAFERRDYQRRNQTLLADYQQLLDSVREIVFRLDSSGRITFLSSSWRDRLGLDPAASLGRDFGDFLHDDARARAADNCRKLFDGVKPVCRDELDFKHADGSRHCMLSHARAVTDGAGRVTGIAGTLTDISDEKAVQSALIGARSAAEAANRAKDEFLSTMSHELRTPLNAVLGLTESLLETEPPYDPERTRRYLGIIHDSGRMLLAQINDILDLAKIESGRLQPEFAPVALDRLCRDVGAQTRPETQAKGLSIEIDAPRPVVISGDERLLGQLLANLVGNAVKFTPAGGRIELSVRIQANGTGAIVVRDTGIGIPADKIDRLFKPFSQVDSSLSRRFGGTGLGLALVERIARLHGGRVAVESQLGVGSTFTVELPLATSAPAAGSLRVLVVDDDPNHQLLLGDFLRHRSFVVLECFDAREALACLDRELPPDLMIVDINMPGMNGLELIGELRRDPRWSRTPIIALTALASPDAAARCIAAGATLHLAKPIPLKTLVEALTRLAASAP